MKVLNKKKDISKAVVDSMSTFRSNGAGAHSNGSFLVYPSPTSNCQIFSIAGFANVFQNIERNRTELNNQNVMIPTRKGSTKLKFNEKYYYKDNSPKIEYCKDSFMKILRGACGAGGNKAQMLIDIKDVQCYTNFIDETFANDIVFKQSYRSTNTSKMVIYLIRTKSIMYYK